MTTTLPSSAFIIGVGAFNVPLQFASDAMEPAEAVSILERIIFQMPVID